MQYEHTQSAPLFWLLGLVAVGMVIGGWYIPGTAGQVAMYAGALVVLLLAFCFQQLNVRDEGEWLRVAFGPIPLFRRRVVYADIQNVERSRTSVLDGWGIHFSPGGGITWNIWGFDCVDVYFYKGRKLRIGTNDPEGLERFLKSCLSTRAAV